MSLFDHTHDLRAKEKISIRGFMERNKNYISGRTLDYGCGKQPYRDVVESVGAQYHGFDRVDFPASTVTQDVGDWWQTIHFNTVVCNQVLQYIPEPWKIITMFRGLLFRGGILIMTYPTIWPEVEEEDLFRFTKAGIERSLGLSDFAVLVHEPRHTLLHYGTEFAVGYGVVARAI